MEAKERSMPLFVLFILSAALTLAAVKAVAADPQNSIEHNRLNLRPPPPRKTRPPCPELNLHAALLSGHGPSCLEKAARNMDVNDRDSEGETALHQAAGRNDLQAAKTLVKLGADLRLKDYQGRDPGQIAETSRFYKLADYLREVERETERLLDAVENNDTVAASSSLKRGAALGTRDIRLDTLLHRAAQSNFPDMGALLIHHGAKLEARNYLGETPLHAAALRDHKEFIRMLLWEGANVNAVDERRRTPLDLAEVRANPEILKLFSQRKARNGAPASVEHTWTESGPPVAAP